jgi:hypothetical protein
MNNCKKSAKTPLLEAEMWDNTPPLRFAYVQNASLRHIYAELRMTSAPPISGFVV